jgi:hypothetical protein
MVAPVESVTLPAMSELELAWPKAAGDRTLSTATGTAAITHASTTRRARLVEDHELSIRFLFIWFLVNIGVASKIVVTSRFLPVFSCGPRKNLHSRHWPGATLAGHISYISQTNVPTRQGSLHLPADNVTLKNEKYSN